MPIDLARTSKQFISLDEFAETIGISRRTLYNWITAGKLDTIKIYGSRRIPIAEARRLAQVELLPGCAPADVDQSTTPSHPADPSLPHSPSRSVKSHEQTH